jgi:hypothetical protein
VPPVQELIGRSEEAAICLARIVAYPVGFEATLDAFTRAVSWGWAFDERIGEWRRGEHERPPAGLLRWGVEFADGRRASNLGGMLGGTGVAIPAGDNEEPDPAKDIRLVPGGGTAADASRGRSSGSGRCRPPVRSRSSANGRATESPRAGLRSRPLRSALRHRKPLRSGLRPGNNGGCRVGRVVIRAQDETEKRAGDRGTLPLSETRASAHRESGHSELVPRERLAGMPGSRTVAVRPGLVRVLFADPLAGQRPRSDVGSATDAPPTSRSA